MQVKVFEAPDMASGLKMIRQELGPDALILSTKTIKNGKLGLLGKQTLEITAAIDKPWPDSPSSPPPGTGFRSQASNSYAKNRVDKTTRSESSSHNIPPQPKHGDDKKDNTSMRTEGSPALRQEFDELRDMVKNLAGEISKISSKDTGSAPAAKSLIHNLEHKLRASKGSNPIVEILNENGVDDEASHVIGKFAAERLQTSDFGDAEKVYNFLHETLADIITVNPPDFESSEKQRRIALVGPTGVGKTTTLAKIAASFLSRGFDSLAFITIDTYRIAAVEQLKVYGEIMHLPVEVVITPQQLRQNLEKHSDKELILIDTAGRSPLDPLGIEEIQEFFTPDLGIDNYLVLSATTRENELQTIYEQFQQIPLHSTIFTKIDECSTLGVLLNMQVKNGSPLSFITNGQRVPEDIITADRQELAQLIIPFANSNTHE